MENMDINYVEKRLDVLISLILREDTVPGIICEELSANRKCQTCSYQKTDRSCINKWLDMKVKDICRETNQK